MSFRVPYWYTLGIKGYGMALRLAARWVPKAHLWTSGRAHWRSRYTEQLQGINKPYWFHCASLGEFEQGRPVIEALKAQSPNISIVVTFFSPSGYEVRKNYEGADAVFYLPLDTTRNARDFVEILDPAAAVFVKYEHWLHLQSALDKKEIPRYLISARLRSNQIFFKPYGKVFREALARFKHIFVQDQASLDAALSLEITGVEVAGDTRFDRVVQIVEAAERDEKLERWKPNEPVLVLGSSWPPEEALAQKHWKGPVIIAPHEIHEEHLQEIEKRFPEAQRYSKHNELDSRVVIIDTMGMLSKLYRYGDGALIGGGFGKGLHNTLEAAAWGLPVFFGPNYHKFIEAKELLDVGAGVCLNSAEDWSTIPMADEWNDIGAKAAAYVRSNVGATPKIVTQLLNESASI